MGIDVLSKATRRRLVSWNPSSVRDCVLWQGPPRPTYNTQPNLLDGACEDVSKWIATSSCVKTNELGYAGNCMRVTNAGLAQRWVYQDSVFVTGNRYTINARARGDGSASPALSIGASSMSWYGAVGNSWQIVSGDYTASSAGFYLYAYGDDGRYAEFDSITLDNLSLTSLSPVVGAPLTQSTATAMPWIDTTTGLVKYQTDVLSWSGAASLSKCLHDGTGGTLIVCVRPSVLNAVNIFASTCALNALNHGMLMWYANDNTAVIYVFNGSGTPDLVTTFACPVAVNNTYVFTVRIRSGVGGVTFRSNSVNKYTGALTAPSTSKNPSAGFKIGDLTYPIDGLIPDCALYNRVLTDSECLRIERYMYRQAEGVDPSW